MEEKQSEEIAEEIKTEEKAEEYFSEGASSTDEDSSSETGLRKRNKISQSESQEFTVGIY
jgi:hypothetical protein